MGIITLLNNPDEFETIPTLNRVQLIDDAFSFSQIGELDYGITFQLLKYLKHEKEYVPWLAALGGLGPINQLMKRTPNQGLFQVRKNIVFIFFKLFVLVPSDGVQINIAIRYRTICNVCWQICTKDSEI
jgi:aminopeptidase N